MKNHRAAAAWKDIPDMPSWIGSHDVPLLRMLNCISYLAKDEIQTSPHLAAKLVDSISQDVIENPESKYLNLGAKDGIFSYLLKCRLMKEMQGRFSTPEEKEHHILHSQIFVDCTSSLAADLARKLLYGSDRADAVSARCRFAAPEGNVKCIYGKDGIAKENAKTYDGSLYSEVFGVKFDVVIGNPPYQENDGGNGISAKPIYNRFVEMALQLDPRFLIMIIPAKWFAAQGKGTAKFSKMMLSDRHIKKMVDYPDSTECFPDVAIGGGVCYFVRDSQYSGPCNFVSIHRGQKFEAAMELDKYGILVRYLPLLPIIEKVFAYYPEGFRSMTECVSSRKPFGLSTKVEPVSGTGDIMLRYNRGVGPFLRSMVPAGIEMIDKYQVVISYLKEGLQSKDGRLRVFQNIGMLPPGYVCTETSLTVGSFETQEEAERMLTYLKSKLLRALVAPVALTQHVTKECFRFVPMLEDDACTDEELYVKYGLTQKEIDYIEWLIRPM